MNLMTQIAEDLAAQVKHKEDKHMIKRDIVETVYEYDCEGKPTSSLPDDNPVKQALREIVAKLEL